MEDEDIKADDPRIGHHRLLSGEGYALDRQFEGASGLRVYRKSPGSSSETVDVFEHGSWGKYDAKYRYEAGSCLESLELAIKKVKYEIWSNVAYRGEPPIEAYSQFLDGYRRGAPVEKTWEGRVAADGAAASAVLEHLMAKFNRDDRPNGKIAHSLSVGDVVVLEEEGLRRAFSVEPFGFKIVPDFAPEEA